MPPILLASLLAIALVATPTIAATLTCDKHGERIDAAAAALGVKRETSHLLTISHQRGVQRFVDQAPHEGAHEGLHWQYCGYDAAAGLHLIRKQHDASFSGQLLDTATGRLYAAGHRVLFNKARTRYLAIEQTSGTDGEHWSVFTRHGKLLWQGFAGETRQSNGTESVIAWYEMPAWQHGSSLSAHIVCADEMRVGLATLQASGGGLQWKKSLDCRD